MHDPHDAIARQAGRRVTLQQVLKINGLRPKDGSGADAPSMWRAGRYEQLARYCARDVRALQEMMARAWVRVPGGGVTKEAAVGWHTGSGATAPRGGAETQGEQGDAGTPKRPRREHTQASYDETTRRRKRTRSEGSSDGYRAKGPRYVARSTRATVTALKRGVEIGARTVDRIVRARYEWRDAGLRPAGAAKRKLWSGSQTWDPGKW